MARNKKNQSAAIRFGPALKAILLCLLIGGSGVGYVWQKGQIHQLSTQMKDREKQLLDLQKLNDRLQKQLGMLRSPRYLNMANEKWKLGLVPPGADQVWRLPEPRPEIPDGPALPPATPKPGERQFAVQNRTNRPE